MRRISCICLLIIGLPFAILSQNISYPLSLITPFDEDTIETVLPMFVWQTDVSALQNNPRLSQQYILVEKNSNQTKSQAVTENQPLHILNQFQGDVYNYEISNAELERGKTYVWQVSLFYNSVLLQSSDPWQFTILDNRPVFRQYIWMKSEYDPICFTTQEDTLLFKIRSNYDFINQKATLITETNESIPILFEPVLVEAEGGTMATIDETIETHLKLVLTELNLTPGIYKIQLKSENKYYYQNFMLQ